MGFLDKFFKKKPSYDITDLNVRDLEVGFVFDYNLKTWEVVEAYVYDWGSSFFSKEFKIKAADETAFLSLEEDDELEIGISKKIKFTELGAEVRQQFMDDKAPSELHYAGERYFFEEESPGFFKKEELSDEAWAELVSFQYESKSGKQFLTVEQWGETDFDASVGAYIEEFELSNILPR